MNLNARCQDYAQSRVAMFKTAACRFPGNSGGQDAAEEWKCHSNATDAR